jgi:hypothetical protein
MPSVQGLLKSAFPCESHLDVDQLKLQVGLDYFEDVKRRFLGLTDTPLAGLQIKWDGEDASVANQRRNSYGRQE